MILHFDTTEKWNTLITELIIAGHDSIWQFTIDDFIEVVQLDLILVIGDMHSIIGNKKAGLVPARCPHCWVWYITPTGR